MKGGVNDKPATAVTAGKVRVRVGRFFRRRKRLTLALVVALLILGPLLTESGGGAFVLNPLGLGVAALVVRRIVRANGQKKRAAQVNCRCRCHRQP